MAHDIPLVHAPEHHPLIGQGMLALLHLRESLTARTNMDLHLTLRHTLTRNMLSDPIRSAEQSRLLLVSHHPAQLRRVEAFTMSLAYRLI